MLGRVQVAEVPLVGHVVLKGRVASQHAQRPRIAKAVPVRIREPSDGALQKAIERATIDGVAEAIAIGISA